jgi:protein arginine kinase activator
MKCQQCEKSATFHITELTGGKPHELHLCEEHAREYLAPAEEEPSAVAGIVPQQLAVGEVTEDLKRLDRRSCPICGITFLEFRKKGRLGCPHDYICFGKELEPLLVNIQGETIHTGKVPRRCPGGTRDKTRLIRLRREMKDAVAKECYERASELRDEIQRIEQAAAGGGPVEADVQADD